MCCHKTARVSLNMCSSLYCTVASLCCQFPKPCWHLETVHISPQVKQPGLWDSRISRYVWCGRCVSLNWHTAFMTGYLQLTYWGQRRSCLLSTLTGCIQTGLVWKKSDMKLSHKLMFFLRSARMQSLSLKRKSNKSCSPRLSVEI